MAAAAAVAAGAGAAAANQAANAGAAANQQPTAGAAGAQPAAGAAQNTGAPTGPLGVPQGNTSKPAMNINPTYIIAGCVAAVILFVIIILVVNRKTVVDLNKFVKEPVFEGYDGYGSAETGFLFDSEAFIEEYAGKIKYTGGNRSIVQDYSSPEEMLADYANGYMDAGTNLKNGDSVEYKWTIDEELLKKLFKKCKIKHSDITYTVSGLTPLKEIDPFDYITVTFDGIAPNGNCALKVESEEDSVNSLYISADKTSGLSNGDTVKVKVASFYTENLDESMAQSYGVILKQTEKEYTVEGLVSYVGEYAELSEEYLTYVKSETEDVIAAYTANNYSDSVSVNDLEYAGYIFENAKDSDSYYGDNNILYVIYSGFVSSSKAEFDKTKVYYPVKFSNIKKGTDGSIEGDASGDIYGWSNISGSWTSTDGYVNPLTCYNELVEAYRDDYVATVGDGFEEYSSSSPIASLDDLYDSCKTVLADRAKEKIEAYIESSYNEDVVVKNLTLDREYLLLAKEPGNDYSVNNKYYVVYSASVSHKEKSFEKTTVYYPVEFNGIVNFNNGEYLVTYCGDIKGSTYFENSWYYTKGYIDADDMYKELITGNRTSYTSDVSKGGKEAKEDKEEAEDKKDKKDKKDKAEEADSAEETTEETTETDEAGEAADDAADEAVEEAVESDGEA